MDNKINRIKELMSILLNASEAYYKFDKPIMSDKEYNDLYDELESLEKDTGIILAGSPTQKVQGYLLDGFKKVKHTKPMLSANKTKDINDIKKFIGNKEFYGSFKLDGATLVVRYENGEFVQGITRGNGTEGEDVSAACKFIKNLPMKIPYLKPLELRGECVVSWEEFNRINKTLEEPYSHPRNLASGTLRNLDLNIVKDRSLSFVAFECVTDIDDSKFEELEQLNYFGFETVMRCKLNTIVDDITEALQPEFYIYPVDGLIFELNSNSYSKSLGATSHHENARIALKWADDLYETILRDIEWNTSKSGLINPIAIFDEIDLAGALTTKATLHNVSYIEDLELGIGDTIQVYRANMVIPKVHDNLDRTNTWELPNKCPSCGGEVEVRNENGSKTLWCKNVNGCKGQLLGRLSHAVSKNALNIDGLSESTIEKLINLNWIKSIKDIYNFYNYKDIMYKMPGFGKKSVDKLFDNIEKSRDTNLQRFLYSLSIPLLGNSASKDIAKYCHNSVDEFVFITSNTILEFASIDGIGPALCDSLADWWDKHAEEFFELLEELHLEKPEENNTDSSNSLEGLTFVVTGSVEHFKNRTELQNEITKRGGKVAGSVSAKTSFLINNDVNSNSGKNKKARELGIKIISESDLLKMF